MTKQISKTIVLAATAGLIVGLTGCRSSILSKNQPPKIINQPQSQTADSGSKVTFSVTAVPEPLLYQWQFDGTDIPGATKATYDIASAGVENVGEYQVLIRQPDRDRAAIVSEKAYLSVYSLAKDLNSGTLTSPINSFPNNSDPSFCTLTFAKVSKYTPFPGPKYSNPSNYPFLTITTTGNAPSLATGIAIQQNSLPPPAPVTDCGNNNSTIATVKLQSGKTYRVGIYCQNAGGNITWNWLYHQ